MHTVQKEAVDQIVEELRARLPFELSHTPTLEQAAYNWLLVLLERDYHRPDLVPLVLEEVDQLEEWKEEVYEYDNDEELVPQYDDAYAIINPYLDRLALLA